MKKLTDKELYAQELRWLASKDDLPKTETGKVLAIECTRHVVAMNQHFSLGEQQKKLLREVKQKLKKQSEPAPQIVILVQQPKPTTKEVKRSRRSTLSGPRVGKKYKWRQAVQRAYQNHEWWIPRY